MIPVLEGLAWFDAAVSIDTRKARVARAAAKAGAKIFNDVSALTYDPQSLAVAAETGLSVILMHAKGEPKTMQDDPRYDDVALEIYDYLAERIAAAEAAGIDRSRIAADPGIGFGKTLAHTLTLLANLSLLHGLGVPLLVGASRKRFISGVSGGETPQSREAGSTPWRSPLQPREYRSCGSMTSPERGRRFPSGRRAWRAAAPNPLAPWRKGVKPLIYQAELM